MDEIIQLLEKTNNITLNNYEFEHLKNEQDDILRSINDNFMIERNVKNKIDNLQELKKKISLDNLNKVKLKPIQKNLKQEIKKIINEEVDKTLKEKEEKMEKNKDNKALENKEKIKKKITNLKKENSKLKQVLKTVDLDTYIDSDIKYISEKRIDTDELKKIKEKSKKNKKSLSKKKKLPNTKKKSKKIVKKFMIVNNNPPYREYYFFQKK